MSAALTPKQRELLDFIVAYQGEHRVTPTFRETMAALGITSTSRVHTLMVALETRGFIRRLYGKARAIEIVESPNLPPAPLSLFPSWKLADELRLRGFTVRA